MRRLLPLLPLALVGCSSEPAPKPDAGAPPVTYKMVPATTGGGAATTPPASAPPTPAGAANPPSPGSD